MAPPFEKNYQKTLNFGQFRARVLCSIPFHTLHVFEIIVKQNSQNVTKLQDARISITEQKLNISLTRLPSRFKNAFEDMHKNLDALEAPSKIHELKVS